MIEHPEPIKWRPWPLEKLRTYPLFVEFAPAFAFDPNGPDIAAGRNVLKFQSLREMAQQADRMCLTYTGQPPPSQVALFLYQFKDEGYEDCLYAHWALHADKTIGPGCCNAAAWIEPVEFPEDGPEIQYWAVYHLTQHPWAGPARGAAERLYRSSKVKWVSPDAKRLLAYYIDRNHGAAEDFFAQAPSPHHPLHV